MVSELKRSTFLKKNPNNFSKIQIFEINYKSITMPCKFIISIAIKLLLTLLLSTLYEIYDIFKTPRKHFISYKEMRPLIDYIGIWWVLFFIQNLRSHSDKKFIGHKFDLWTVLEICTYERKGRKKKNVCTIKSRMF